MQSFNSYNPYSLCERLYPILRSLTGDGNRESLAIIKEYVADLAIYEVPTGYQAFDWKVPNEWNITEAYIDDEFGNRIVDIKNQNLHIVGYSTPIDEVMSLSELEPHLYSLPESPDWIPYVASYYKERWGFCLQHSIREKLKDVKYHVVIKSELKAGHLTYADFVLKGDSEKEILFSTYICHPQMCNNELSGIAVQVGLILWLMSLPKRRYTYRFVFAPETIGSIIYLSKHLEEMKRNTIAGYVLTCLGGGGKASKLTYIASRTADTLADKVALKVLKKYENGFESRTFLDRGSDERQYCSPKIDLPVCSVTRSKYGEYPEYHTSADNLDFISKKILDESIDFFKNVITLLENNYHYELNIFCEPQLGKYGLYPTLMSVKNKEKTRDMTNFIAYCDGKSDLIDISNKINSPVDVLIDIAKQLESHNIISRSELKDIL